MTPLEALAAGVPPVLLDTAGGARELSARRRVLRAAERSSEPSRAGSNALLFDDAVRSRVLGAAPSRRWRTTAGRARPATRWRSWNAQDPADVDRCLDHHRLLQRARRSRALPRVAARRAAAGLSRDRRRRQPVHRRQRRGARRFPGVHVIEQDANVGFARANNIGHPREHRNGPAAAEQRHDRARPARSIASSTALDRGARRRRSSVRAWSTAAVAPSCRSGRMIGPLNELRQKR